MPQSFPDHLIAFLKNPGSYPHNPGQVEHIQTHISHVFIAPPFVYKFKKPVNFDFLDFSTPDKRKYFCKREVELNRRLCEGLYLGVVPVFLENGSWSFESTNSASRVEYAVKMNLLEKKNFLIHTVKEGKLSKEHLDRVINKLIPFYKSQTPDEKILKYGKPEKIKVNTDENFKQAKPFIGDTIPKHTYYAIRTYTQRFLDENRELFLKRIDKKRIVDGHGDLHLEHIYLTGDHVCIYDCIEFNERFRYQDITSDISFLAMDLDFNNLRNEARYFVEEMSTKLHDPDVKQLIDFYKCYRSYVRGKVKSLQSSEEEVSQSDRAQAAGLAGLYFQLSLSYALFGSKPTVLIFMGRVGSGKSTIARHLAEEVGLIYLASDITRKKMGGIPLSKRTPSSKRNQLYSDEMSDRTYKELIETAKIEIISGKNLILDATFSNPSYRNQLLLLLINIEAEYYFIETEAPAVVRKKRLENREQDSSVISDARHEDFEMLDSRYDPPSEINPHHLIRINTDKSKEESILQLFRKLVDIQLS